MDGGLDIILNRRLNLAVACDDRGGHLQAQGEACALSREVQDGGVRGGNDAPPPPYAPGPDGGHASHSGGSARPGH